MPKKIDFRQCKRQKVRKFQKKLPHGCGKRASEARKNFACKILVTTWMSMFSAMRNEKSQKITKNFPCFFGDFGLLS
ncbi:hypothetical protein DYE50_02710 [Treponema ruminis]|nr:hypothetical protein DYE50_02710 [Treponema ruminis]